MWKLKHNAGWERTKLTLIIEDMPNICQSKIISTKRKFVVSSRSILCCYYCVTDYFICFMYFTPVYIKLYFWEFFARYPKLYPAGDLIYGAHSGANLISLDHILHFGVKKFHYVVYVMKICWLINPSKLNTVEAALNNPLFIRPANIL